MTKIELLSMTDDKLDSTVKIQGTAYDRKRKLSEKIIKKMTSLSKKGETPYAIAKKLGLNYTTVRYNTDPAWKAHHNATRDGRHCGKDKITVKNRVAYKRSLVAAGKVGA